MSEHSVAQAPIKVATPAPPAALQRACACGEHSHGEGECEECKKKGNQLQRAAAGPGLAVVLPIAHEVLRSTGQPPEAATRAFMEPRFNAAPQNPLVQDLSVTRVQTVDAVAISQPSDSHEREAEQAASQVMQALSKRATPSVGGLSKVSPTIQRAVQTSAATPVGDSEAEAGSEPASLPGLLVGDEAENVAANQMRKSEFLAQLRAEICAATDGILASSGRSTEGCPYLRYWFGYYQGRSSQQIERALYRYAPEVSNATSAQEYISGAVERVRRAVEIWATTGEITGVPEGLSSVSSDNTEANPAVNSPSVQFKNLAVGPQNINPQSIQSQLRGGRALEGEVRSRMESAFNCDFSGVRIHTDTQAASLSSSMNARALTLGQNVAFGSSEYQPGTLLGDALIAHELAHVVQQGEAEQSSPLKAGTNQYIALEEDADYSAIDAVASVWGGVRNIAQDAIPRLRSGLSLQRCGKSKEDKNAAVEKIADLVGNPQDNEAAVIAVIDEMGSDAADVLMRASPFSPKSSDAMLNVLAGSEQGQRILERASQALKDGDSSSRVRARDLDKVLKDRKAAAPTLKVEEQKAIDRINKAIDADPRKEQYLKAKLPLRLPVTIYQPGQEMMGGVYYNSSMPSDPKAGGDAGRTGALAFTSDKHPARYPLISIQIGPLALAMTDEYVRSVMWHEFQHYKQYLSFREPESSKSAQTQSLEAESRSSGRTSPNMEIEATSIELAGDFAKLSDDEVKQVLSYLADHYRHPKIKAEFRDAATDRIKAAVAGDRAKQDRLIRLIKALSKTDRESLADVLAAINANLAPKPKASPKSTK